MSKPAKKATAKSAPNPYAAKVAAPPSKPATFPQKVLTAAKPTIQIGMNLQGESLENWANLTLQDIGKILELDQTKDSRMSALVPHAIDAMRDLLPTSPAKIRSVQLCEGLKLPAQYEEDWSLHTLGDLARVLGLPEGATLKELPVHAKAVWAEIQKVRD